VPYTPLLDDFPIGIDALICVEAGKSHSTSMPLAQRGDSQDHAFGIKLGAQVLTIANAPND